MRNLFGHLDRTKAGGALQTSLALARIAALGLGAAIVTPTLDEVTIEGEIAMPQVLFITARAPFQYPDQHHLNYLPDSKKHAITIPYPCFIWIIGHERPSSLELPNGFQGLGRSAEDQG